MYNIGDKVIRLSSNDCLPVKAGQKAVIVDKGKFWVRVEFEIRAGKSYQNWDKSECRKYTKLDEVLT